MAKCRKAHLNWLRSLPLTYDDGRRLFVHAGVDPHKPLGAQDEHDLIWIREPFLDDDRDYGRLIVHGHTPLETAKPDLRPNRLNLDTAAVFGGPLTRGGFRRHTECADRDSSRPNERRWRPGAAWAAMR